MAAPKSADFPSSSRLKLFWSWKPQTASACTMPSKTTPSSAPTATITPISAAAAARALPSAKVAATQPATAPAAVTSEAPKVNTVRARPTPTVTAAAVAISMMRSWASSIFRA